MGDYKVMPVEPTAEMERAAESYWNERRFKGLSEDPRTWAGVYQAMLAAAPAVQGETRDGTYHPLKNIDTWRKGCPCAVREPGECPECTDGLIDAIERWFLAGPHEVRRAAAQPAPDVSALVEALDRGFPLLSDEGLDEVEHHCEYVIQRERKRVHSILAAHRNQGGEA